MQIFKSRSLLPLLIAMIGVACVKDPQDIPPGLTNDPVFGMTGQFGNQNIDIDAGVSQWTFVPVVNEVDSVQVYSSILSQNACVNNCPSSWTFNFYQSSGAASNEQEKFNSTIKKGDIDFVLSDSERDSFNISISTHPDLFMNGVSFWEDPDSNDAIYANEFKQTVGSNQVFDACFQSVVYAGCQYQQCVYFKPSTLIPCLVHIEAQVENGNYVVLNAVPEGTPPFQIHWEDGPSTSSLVVAVSNPVHDIYANVTVIDANGNRAELVQTIRLQDSIIDACYYPINITSTPFTNSSASLAAGNVEIVHVDDNGEEWRSTKTEQPSDAYLQIHEVVYYDIAPSGLPAYKTSLSVHVLLTNSTTGASQWFNSDNVVLPLSHPE